MKTMKHLVVELLFEDDGSFDVGDESGYTGGCTPAPSTDKETRRRCQVLEADVRDATDAVCDDETVAEDEAVADDEDDEDGGDDQTDEEIEALAEELAAGSVDDPERLAQLHAVLEQRRGGTGLLPRLGDGLRGMFRSTRSRSSEDEGKARSPPSNSCPSSVRPHESSGCSDAMPSERSGRSEDAHLGTVQDSSRIDELSDMLNQKREWRTGGSPLINGIGRGLRGLFNAKEGHEGNAKSSVTEDEVPAAT